MIPYIIILLMGILLLLVVYGLGSLLGFVIAYTSITKKIIMAYRLSYLIPILAIGYGIYGIVKHLFF